MTAIVGLVHDGRVYLGGDSAASNAVTVRIRADEKVFSTGPYIFGFTSSFRMGQLLRYSLRLPDPTGDLNEFMATTFVDGVRRCLKEGGYAKTENNREEAGTFLVGIRGELFMVEEDFQVGISRDGYDACGSGEDFALGALHATRKSGLLPRRRLELALKAAAHHNPYVRAPFVFVEESGGRPK